MSVTNPLDQPQVLQVQIKDNNPFSETYGQLVDPGGLELIVQPAGEEPTTYTYADAEIVKASTGVYYYIVPADVSGQWSYRWIAGVHRASDVRPLRHYTRSLPLVSPWGSSPAARPKDAKTSESWNTEFRLMPSAVTVKICSVCSSYPPPTRR